MNVLWDVEKRIAGWLTDRFQLSSEDCRTQAFNKHHQLLCVGQLTTTQHPLFLFKQHAIENYELFLLAAQVREVFLAHPLGYSTYSIRMEKQWKGPPQGSISIFR